MSSTRGHVGIEGEEGTFQGTHDVRLVSSSFMAAPPPEPEPVPKAAPVPVPAFRFASPMQRPAPSTPPPGRHPQGLALGYSPDRPLYSSPEGGDGRDSWEQPLLSSPERKAHRSQHSTVGHVPASNQYNDIPDTAARRSPSPKKNVQRKPPSRFVGSSLPFSRTGAHWRPTHQAYGSNISIPDVIGSDDPLAIERRLNAAAATVMVGTGTAHDASQKDLTGDASINPKHHVTMMAQQPTHETLVDQPVGSQTSANSQHHPKSVAIGTDPPTEKEAASRSHTKATLLPTDVDEDPDGYLHAVEKTADRNHGLSCQGVLNMATVVLLAALLVLLFAGYPLMDHFLSKQIDWSRFGLGAGGTNGSGQIPAGLVRTLVDSDTPQSALQWKNNAGSRFDLVFSDEFNVDGRTFYPGDDPFWEAPSIWYGATGDYEWYSPEGVNTSDGALTFTLTQKETHNLNFQSGMLQSWNKFCFQGGYIEFNVLLPTGPARKGYWPAAWLMGNLGRAGFTGSTEGLWPYNYDSCDTGILKGQKFVNGSGPEGALHSQAPYSDKGKISNLPGMRASACTCDGEDHPGPNLQTGRGASEIDVFEMQVQEGHTHASQSLQVAPFDLSYYAGNSSSQISITDKGISEINTYHGGPLQESASVVTRVPDENFPETDGRYVRYGVEYSPDWDGNGNGYIQWWMDGKPTWQMKGSALGPQSEMDIGQRLIPTEPLSIVMNLGLSAGFQQVDWNGKNRVVFPAQMKFDYVRLYQPHGQPARVSCDPPDHPTADYIQRHLDLYYNPNLTTYNKPWPRNALTGCS